MTAPTNHHQLRHTVGTTPAPLVVRAAPWQPASLAAAAGALDVHAAAGTRAATRRPAYLSAASTPASRTGPSATGAVIVAVAGAVSVPVAMRPAYAGKATDIRPSVTSAMTRTRPEVSR